MGGLTPCWLVYNPARARYYMETQPSQHRTNPLSTRKKIKIAQRCSEKKNNNLLRMCQPVSVPGEAIQVSQPVFNPPHIIGVCVCVCVCVCVL